ncbi:acyltransferase [Methylocapsa sp. S129]|uniref:acyltransferase family protein n=1 Tax=Methylocapsa sp. S129 TaxID=1641869 RepID=UPI00131D904C|nr:acyltransferase [Methylocapsa sp. S129]
MKQAAERGADTQRLVFLDGVRGLAAIAVLLYHFTLGGAFPIARMGYFAVDLFFCLSGFILARTYQRRLSEGMPASQFMLRRFIRLYPLYFAGLAIGFVALCLKSAANETDYSAADLFGALRNNLIFLPWFNDRTIVTFGYRARGALFPENVAAWSLFFELAVNIVFAYCASLGRKYLVALVAASLLAYLAYMMTFGAQPGWAASNFWGGAPRVLYGFFAGVAVHEALRHREGALGELKISRASGLFQALALSVLLIWLFSQPFILAYPLGLLLAPFIVLVGARIEVGGGPARFCSLLGWLSYPLYCLHWPIFSLVTTLANARGDSTASPFVIGVALLATLVAAVCLTLWFEEPTRRMLSALLLRRAGGVSSEADVAAR